MRERVRAEISEDDRGRIQVSIDPWVESKDVLVPWREAFRLPPRFSASVDDPGLPYRLDLDLETRDGEVVCTAVCVKQRPDGPYIQPRALRGVRLASYVRLAAATQLSTLHWIEQPAKKGERVYELSRPVDAPNFETAWNAAAAQRARRQLTDDHLREVANVYQAAERYPTKAVQKHAAWAPIGYSTAARWVAEARSRTDPATGEHFLPKRG